MTEKNWIPACAGMTKERGARITKNLLPAKAQSKDEIRLLHYVRNDRRGGFKIWLPGVIACLGLNKRLFLVGVEIFDLVFDLRG